MRKILLSAILAVMVFGVASVSTAEAAWRRPFRPYYVNGRYYNPAYSYTVPVVPNNMQPYYYNGHWYNPAFSYTVPVR